MDNRGCNRKSTIHALALVVICQWTLSLFWKDSSSWTRPSACGTSYSLESSPTRSLRIAHVWSPFVPHDKDQFYPLDQGQSLAWSSIVQARENYRRFFSEEVHVVCAILWTDVDILMQHQPTLCQPENTIVLNRSSQTEFPSLKPPIHYPFIQDVISAADADNYDYLIFSNADIVLTQDFYIHVRRTIENHGYDAFRVNRRTIWSRVDQLNHSLTPNHLQYIEKELLPNGEHHPGTDCYVMRKDVVEGLDMGMLFSGCPPWAGALNWYLLLGGSQDYQSFGSKFGWTYHIGNDRAWVKATRYTRLEGVSNETIFQSYEDCPLRLDMHTALERSEHWQQVGEKSHCGHVFLDSLTPGQNVINCAAVAKDLHLMRLDKQEIRLLQAYYEAEGRRLSHQAWEKVERLVPLQARRKTVFVNTNPWVVPKDG